MDFFYRVSNEWATQENADEINSFRDNEYELAEEVASHYASLPGWGIILIEKIYFGEPDKTELVKKFTQPQWKNIIDPI